MCWPPVTTEFDQKGARPAHHELHRNCAWFRVLARSRGWPFFSGRGLSQRFHFLAPRSKQTDGSFLVEVERLCGHCIGNPLGKWNFLGDVFTGRGVHSVNLCKVSDWESFRDSDQRGP
jgi:hypothetical protein